MTRSPELFLDARHAAANIVAQADEKRAVVSQWLPSMPLPYFVVVIHSANGCEFAECRPDGPADFENDRWKMIRAIEGLGFEVATAERGQPPFAAISLALVWWPEDEKLLQQMAAWEALLSGATMH